MKKRTVRITVFICIVVLFVVVSFILYFRKTLQTTTTYAFQDQSFALGDYSLTQDNAEVVFIGRLNTISTAADGSTYANITYANDGRNKSFLIPFTDSLFVLLEPQTASLESADSAQSTPLSFSELRSLQGRTMAFYLGVDIPSANDITPIEKNTLQDYFTFLHDYLDCNNQFAKTLGDPQQTAPCTPYIQAILVKK